jgi:hypothetical protein
MLIRNAEMARTATKGKESQSQAARRWSRVAEHR